MSTIEKPGLHADGDGLYLVVSNSGAKRWSFIFHWEGKRKEMGLGKLSAVSLADARELAFEARNAVAKGINPIEQRQSLRRETQAASVSFGDYADGLVDKLAIGFRNQKHIEQWRMTLREYARPLRALRLDEIGTAEVMAVLSPIWTTRNETASRLRGRIERVLDAAKAEGLRSGENPARWRGHLSALLPKRHKLSRGRHAALPYPELPRFYAGLKEKNGVGALALRFIILTAARTGEVRFARWDEVDLSNGLWVIPADRMKAGREHRVPLSSDALDLLKVLSEVRLNAFVFPGQKQNAPISSATVSKTLKQIGFGHITVHGFRSSFRDWAGDMTHFAREIAEAALAHQIGDASERAYRRGDALEKRRQLMDAWCDYLNGDEAPEDRRNAG